MAITCGVGINNAMASAVNMLGDVHGGAGEQCVALYNAIAGRLNGTRTSEQRLAEAVRGEITVLSERGCGMFRASAHRFHPVDPRAPRLLELVDAAAKSGAVSGRFAAIGRAIEAQLAAAKGRRDPDEHRWRDRRRLCRLGFPPPLCRGLFVLSRSVGALAHAFEEMQSGERNKGPIPRQLIWTYTGPPPRDLAGRSD